MSTISNGRHLSKGKWIPGMKPHVSTCQHYCDVCEREFANDGSLQKHLASELHFKRRAKKDGKVLRKDDELFDEEVFPISVYREKRKRGNAVSSVVTVGKNGEQIIRCPTCFSKVDKLLMGKHLISHFHCQKVNRQDRQSDPEKKLILEHIHQIVLQSPFQCGPCKYYFTQREQLLQHFEEYHMKLEVKLWSKGNILNRWRCSSCPDILANNEIEMQTHLVSADHCKMEAAISKSIPIILRKVFLQSCQICAKSFVLNRELVSHVKRAHNVIVEGTLENICMDFQLPTTHKMKIESSPEKCDSFSVKVEPRDVDEPTAIKCDICRATFSQISSLNRHKAHAHRSQTASLYKCSTCSYTTPRSSHFQRHSKQHNNVREKSYQCEICLSSFFELYALEHHKKIHFKKSAHCSYPECQFVGRTQSDVDAHYMRHTVDRKFKCDECDYSSKSKFTLKRHKKLSHNDRKEEKGYACKMCSYSTNLYNCLKRHELQHQEGKSFRCPHCSFSSKTLENLRIHVVKRKIHSGRFLYNCGACLPTSLDKTVFATNSFSEFKYHITESHVDGPLLKTDLDLLVIAGIKKLENDDTTIVPDIGDVAQEKGFICKNSPNEEKCFAPNYPSFMDEKPFPIANKSQSDNEFCNGVTGDIYIDELYDNLLIVSDEGLHFGKEEI